MKAGLKAERKADQMAFQKAALTAVMTGDLKVLETEQQMAVVWVVHLVFATACYR